MNSMENKTGWLVLQTGECYPGTWRGPRGQDYWRAGEVVFNTSHSGYEEIATDPSYFSQIVVMSATMQGNYGVQDKAWESRQFWIQGFVANQIYNDPTKSNDEINSTWTQRLATQQVPSLSDLDTREIVLRLRSSGTPWGALVEAVNEAEAFKFATALIEKQSMIEKDWCHLVSRKTKEIRTGHNPNGPVVAVLDLGCKENIIRELVKRCSRVEIFPARTSVVEVAKLGFAGLLVSNGPGDPADVEGAQEFVKAFLGKIPIFGICMGHQILGLALGGKTYKMKFGHRGANHPIEDRLLKKVYISSQNHGYAVVAESLPKDVVCTHTNLNDGSVAGIFSAERNCLGIQYHPESHPGPHEADALFDYFVDFMIQGKKSFS